MNQDDQITNLRETISELKTEIAILKERESSWKEVAKDVQMLKEARQQALGERTIMISLAIFIGGVLQAIAASFFGKHS